MNPNQLSALVPKGYILVAQSEDDEVEQKSCTDGRTPPTPSEAASSTQVVPLRPLRSHPAFSRGLKANKPMKAWLSYYQGQSAAANTATAFGFVIQPNLDSSWASWQGVFDEFKVLQAELMFNAFYTVDPTAMPANSANAIVAYDPTNSIALSSVNAGLQFERWVLQRIMIPAASGPKVSPMVTTKDGFTHLKVKPPPGQVNSTVDTLNSGGSQWRPTSNAVNYNWGAFIGYQSQGGTTSVIRTEGFVRMLVEFRVRI